MLMLMLWFELVYDCNATVNGCLSATALILSDGLLILFFSDQFPHSVR